MKKTYTIVFALMVLLAMAMSAEALESKTMTRQSGDSAFASWSTNMSYAYLSVTETNNGTNIYVYTCDFSGCRSGIGFTQDDVLTMNKKQETATLSLVNFQLFNYNTGTVETVNIQVQWEGVGDVSKDRYTSTSKSGDFTYKSSSDSIYRAATATGSIGDIDLGTTNYSDLVEFKSATMTMNK